MKRWLPHPLQSALLCALWLLLNNSVAAAHIGLGLLLGWAIPLFARAFWPQPVRLRHPARLLRFAGVLLHDVIVANLVVARLILGGPRRLRPAFVVVPLELTDDLAISLLASTISLTPGTVAARLSEDRRQLLVHALDCGEPQALVVAIKTRLEAPLKEIFEC